VRGPPKKGTARFEKFKETKATFTGTNNKNNNNLNHNLLDFSVSSRMRHECCISAESLLSARPHTFVEEGATPTTLAAPLPIPSSSAVGLLLLLLLLVVVVAVVAAGAGGGHCILFAGQQRAQIA
jgi:hypothetical protein